MQHHQQILGVLRQRPGLPERFHKVLEILRAVELLVQFLAVEGLREAPARVAAAEGFEADGLFGGGPLAGFGSRSVGGGGAAEG